MWTCEAGICSWCRDCIHPHLWQCLSWDLSPCNKMFWGPGIGAAVLSAICNGSFSALAKCSRVQRAKVPPYVFNFWLCLGVCFASAPIGYATAFRCLSLQGCVSGLLFVLSTAASMQAIQLIGLYQAIGIGCATAALVSFAFGAVVETGSIMHLPAAITGMASLLLGITLIACAGVLQQSIAAAEEANQQQEGLQQPLLQQQPEHLPLLDGLGVAADAAAAAGTNSSTDTVLQLNGAQQQQQHAEQRTAQQQQQQQTAFGLLLAVTTGIFGGLILAPMDFVGRECRGLPYQAALGLGVLLAAPAVTYCLHWLSIRQFCLKLPTQPVAAALPGMLAGAIWAAGSASSMLATSVVGLAIAYPIMQAGLFVAGLWGILLYHELYSLKPHLVYWLGGAVVVGGAVLVVSSGQE